MNISNVKKTGLLKYGSCNINSLVNALKLIDADFEIITSTENLKKFDTIILPGVGNMKAINDETMQQFSYDLKNYIETGKILYGICLGLQMLFEYSEESKKPTLGLLKGKSISIRNLVNKKLNVNFNNLLFTDQILKNKLINKLFFNIENDSKFYHLHSYYCEPSDDNINKVYCKVDNIKIPTLFYKNNIIGTQFHPELSKFAGLRFLTNLIKI